MTMDPLGGSLPAARPAVVAVNGITHVFAIGFDAQVHHWQLDAAGGFTGPVPLPVGNFPASSVAAVALADGTLHVFAIAPGGPMAHWRGTGNSFVAEPLGGWNMPADRNGVAAASWGGRRLDVIAVQSGNLFGGGVVFHGGWDDNGAPLPLVTLPGANNFGASVPALVATPGRLDAFAVGAGGAVYHWIYQSGGWLLPTVLEGATVANGAPMGVAAYAYGPGRIDVFGIDPSGHVRCWPLGLTSACEALLDQTAIGPVNCPGGVPAIAVVGSRTDVFAINRDGMLARWQRIGGAWTTATLLDGFLAAGGVAAAVNGGRVDVLGIRGQGGFTTLERWPGGIAGAGNDAWHNWANNQRVDHPLGHLRAAALEELIAIVKQAGAAGKQVRAVGSSWSSSEVAVTGDYIVETNRMGQVLGGVVPAALGPRRFVHVEAGIRISNLIKYLDDHALAPFTMGGSDGQTLAGALSTSVHGADFDRGPFPDAVRALHLVAPDGSQHWIEGSDRITDDATLHAALGPDLVIHGDDDWLDAAAVAVGTLGIVYAIVLEVRDQYDVIATTRVEGWRDLRRKLELDVDFEANRGLLIAIDPSEVNGDHACYVSTRVESTPSSGGGGGGGGGGFGIPGLSGVPLELALRETIMAMPAVIGSIRAFLLALPFGVGVPIMATLDGLAATVPPHLPVFEGLIATIAASAGLLGSVVAELLKAGNGAVGDWLGSALNGHADVVAKIVSTATPLLMPPGEKRGWAHTVLAGSSDDIEKLARGPGLEIAFDCNDGSHLRFMDEFLGILAALRNQNLALGGWLSMRFVGHGRSLLSPEQSSRSCLIEIASLRSLAATPVIIARMEEAARRHNGIGHWGMAMDLLQRDDTARGYPNLDTWRKVRAALTAGGTIHTFDGALAQRCGLTDLPGAKPRTPTMTRVAPAFAAGAPGDLFGLGSDGHVYQRTRDVPRATIGIGGRTGTIGTPLRDPEGVLRMPIPGTWSRGFAPVKQLDGLTHLEAITNADGRVELCALDRKGALWHTWQNGARGGEWGDWTRILGATLRDLAVARDTEGRIQVFGPSRGDFLTVTPFMRATQLAANSGWSGLTAVGNSNGARRCAAGANADGRLEVFLIDDNPGLWHCWQNALGVYQPWSPIWSTGGLGDLKDLVVANHAYGRLVVFGLARSGQVHVVEQTSPNGGWGGWAQLGSAAGLHTITVGRHADGHLELFGLDGGDGLWRIAQTGPDAGWGTWSQWAGLRRAKHVTAASNSDGRLELFAIDQRWNLQHAWQIAANGTWSEWTAIQ